MTEIPDKLYFKIGEVAQIVGVKPHVLRYWESEFPAVRPAKSQGNQRLYRKSQIEQLVQLKDLLHRQGFTLTGAKKQLQTKKTETTPFDPPQKDPGQALPLFSKDSETNRDLLVQVRNDLRRLRQSLD